MKKWKVALIGCGSIADNTYLPRIGEIPEADLVAVCDIIPERAKNYAEKFHVPAWYTSIDELLEKCDFEILMNTTSIPAHHEINMKALRAGKHLYSQWGVRITLSFLLAGSLGLNGVWLAMAAELCVRGLIFMVRLYRGRWLNIDLFQTKKS